MHKNLIKNQIPSIVSDYSASVKRVSKKEALKKRYGALAVIFLLVITTAVVYSGVFGNDFIPYDDDRYVTENSHVRQELTWDNIFWAFTAFHAGNWHPLTWLSHMLDVQLYGLNSAGHHFTNLFLHIIATLLLFGFLRYTTGRLWPTALVAALFALHPLHVESVAWVAERKDVLSTVFGFATMWAYVHYTRSPGIGRYAVVVLLFALGLMTKPMLVTLPVILLLLDYWPLERFSPVARSTVRLIAEKIPLFVMSIASAIITIIAQQGAIGSFGRLSLGTRLSNTAISYCIYIGQAFCPFNIAVFYPHPKQPYPLAAIGGALLLIAVTVVVLLIGKRRRYLTTGWLWYLIALVPVIGLIQVGEQGHADRYTYVSYIGIFIMIAWGLKALADRLPNGRKMLLIIIVAILFAITIGITWKQIGYWKNGITLFSHAAAVTKENYLAHNQLGFLLDSIGRTDEAFIHYQKALEIKPHYSKAHYNLGRLLENAGRTDDAVAQYRKAVGIEPDDADFQNNLGIVLVETGQLDEAVAHYLKALEINPAYYQVYNNLAIIFEKTGHIDKAIENYKKALEIKPQYGEAHFNLGNIFVRLGNINEAITHYRKALEICPNDAGFHNNLGYALLQINKTDEAVTHYQTALKINPDRTNTLLSLADIFALKGQTTDAISLLKRALALEKSSGDSAKVMTIEQMLERVLNK